ncbi:MAG: anaerobic ribonucleoside-triphosphate reductase activating protein [Erysipelothrix sp.]|nr:anaerobic ribonucleoside-triphosphate reductase activating protein [Erysipelothrix sp.]
MSNISSLRLASQLEFDSVSNGQGLRMVLWFQGCFYECKGCHNQESWDLDGGNIYLIDDIIKVLKNNLHYDGITLSGGDPLLQAEALKVLLPKIKHLGLNVWLYSGDVYENLSKKTYFKDIEAYIDVLVDGPFILSQLDLNLKFKGSKNQRIIDINKTINNNQVTLLDLN